MSTTSQQHAPARTSPIALTSNEINILIHCYLLESGLTHSAYTFHLETKIAQVNPPELLGASVPRGELIRYLHKALLWTEIESHMTEVSPHGLLYGSWTSYASMGLAHLARSRLTRSQSSHPHP